MEVVIAHNMRLNKYLSQLGIASRRQADNLISQKRVLLNNRLAQLGDQVDPEVDQITVDKKIIPPYPQKLVYYLLHKPKYYLSTTTDDRGRQTVLDLVPGQPRVYPVGRLDFESTGLIILTNDGELSLRLTHPRYHLPKVYLVTVLGKTPQAKIISLNTSVSKAKIIRHQNNQTTIEITLYTGKKRQIRQMCADLHLYLLDLHRISIGKISLGALPPGQYRLLTPKEIEQLKY